MLSVIAGGMSEADRHVALRGGNGRAFPFFPFLALPFPFTTFGFKSESLDATEASDSSSEEVDELDGVFLRGFLLLLLLFGGGEGESSNEETEVSESESADDKVSSTMAFAEGLAADRVIGPGRSSDSTALRALLLLFGGGGLAADRVIRPGRSSDSTALGALRFGGGEGEISDSDSESDALRAFECRSSDTTALGALRGCEGPGLGPGHECLQSCVTGLLQTGQGTRGRLSLLRCVLAKGISSRSKLWYFL